MEHPGDITRLLLEMRDGHAEAGNKLIPLVYQELLRVARSYMSRERRDHSLQPTALVHEAYLRLVNQRDKTWHSRAHFFGVAAHLMRLILVDHARSHRASKRGGKLRRESLDDVILFEDTRCEDLIALDEALEQLASWDPRMARIVEMRFFADLSEKEVAAVLGVSSQTVKRDWKMARRWLKSRLAGAADKEK